MFETNLNKKQIDIVHFTIFNLCLDLDWYYMHWRLDDTVLTISGKLNYVFFLNWQLSWQLLIDTRAITWKIIKGICMS